MTDSKIPITVAAVKARLTREVLLRRVQTGVVEGEQVGGRWFVDRESLDRYVAERAGGQRQPSA